MTMRANNIMSKRLENGNKHEEGNEINVSLLSADMNTRISRNISPKERRSSKRPLRKHSVLTIRSLPKKVKERTQIKFILMGMYSY